MKPILPYAGAALVVVLTLISAAMQGRLSNRWGPPADLLAAAKRFENIPKEFGSGPWRLVSEEEMSEKVIHLLELPESGYLNGQFLNDETGARVNMFIVLGPPGPIAVHTPEICYSSRAHDIKEKRERVAVGPREPKGQHEFWALTLRSTDVTRDLLRVYYGWGNDRYWGAPDSARRAFGGQRMLFKMQLAAELPPESNLKEADTCKKFLEDFLPVVTPVLFYPDDEGTPAGPANSASVATGETGT